MFVKKNLNNIKRKTIEEFRNSKKNPVSIILENVRSLHNVGSIFRTADAFLIKKIWLCGITPQPPHREIQKSALGATQSVIWEYAKDTESLVKNLKTKSYEIIAIEQTHNSENLYSSKFTNNINRAFIFGNEVEGVSNKILKYVDRSIEIQQFGTKHSFNISISVGIVLWEYLRQLRKYAK